MLLSKVEPKGANYTTSYEYNALRSLTKVTDANNSSWNFQYDDVQNLTQKEDALNRITSYEYDNLDRLDKTTQPLNKITTYGYDNNSNVLTTTDPKNQTMTYTYDKLDRVDTGIYRNELNAEKLFHDYKYDAEDNLYEVAERVDFTNNRTYTKTFDKRNRLKSSTDAYSKTVAFTYDSANNLKSLTDAGSKVTSYNYDSQNRLDTVAQNSSTIADYDWYADGLLKQVKYSETSKRDYNYDNADRVSNITNTIGTGSESFDYGYDANSNRETEARNINGAVSKTIAYGYDQLNRLESASYTANSATNQLTYTYDKVGNRKTESGTDQQGNAVNKTADYDDLDRLTKLTETNLVSDFEYDDNSNLTKVKLNNVDNETFEYDIRNQLSKYTSIGNGISADYDYDFERKRLSKTVSGNRRDYVYAGNQVINEYLADNLNASYGIGSGEIVKSDFVGEGSRNYFSDALGSITSLADTSSSLISRNDYDSFGEIVSSTGSSQNAVTYTGQRLDVESGLMALGNGERYYNPSYGRFIQQDSYQGMPDMPQSLNRFSYVYNNPFSYTDPSGNKPDAIQQDLRVAKQKVDNSSTGNWYADFVLALKARREQVTYSVLKGIYNVGKEVVYTVADGVTYLAADAMGFELKDMKFSGKLAQGIQQQRLGGKSAWDIATDTNVVANVLTLGIYGAIQETGTNVLDYAEGRITEDQYNERMGGLLGEQIFDLATAGAGKSTKAFKAVEQGTSKAVKATKQGLNKIKQGSKQMGRDFVKGYKSTRGGKYFGTGGGGIQGYLDKVEGSVRNVISERSTRKSLTAAKGGQVDYGSFDLSMKAIEFRKAEGMYSGRNVAVFEYLEENITKTIVRASERGVGHSERIIKKEIENLGIPKENITRIYSELEPCMVAGGYCKRMIENEFPQAIINYSFEYGSTKASRQSGVKALKKAAGRLRKNNERK